MPASMISAAMGSSPYVTGSNSAMVVMGPMPGSTPINVPSRQPRRQAPRLVSVAATPKPVPRLARTSTSAAPHAERLAEQHHEQEPAKRRHGDGECYRFQRSHRLGGETCDRHDCGNGGDEAGALDEKAARHDGREHGELRKNLRAFDARSREREAFGQDDDAEADEPAAHDGRQVAGAHLDGGAQRVVAGDDEP